jgi:hypothetical protein
MSPNHAQVCESVMTRLLSVSHHIFRALASCLAHSPLASLFVSIISLLLCFHAYCPTVDTYR